MKTKTYMIVLAVVMAAGLLSFQLVTGAYYGGTMNGSDTMNPQTPQVMVMKTKVVPGSEQGKYDIQVTAGKRNFTVLDMQGEKNIPKMGHVHFYLDTKPAYAKGKPAIPVEGSVWAHVSGNTYTFTNVSPGKHRVFVELVNNDHTPLDPVAIVWKTVNIRG